jgi:hypothetical protein
MGRMKILVGQLSRVCNSPSKLRKTLYLTKLKGMVDDTWTAPAWSTASTMTSEQLLLGQTVR